MLESPKKRVEAPTGAGLVADQVPAAPDEMTEYLRDSAQMKRKVAIVFVEKINFGRSNFESQPAHVPVRLFGLEQDAVKANRPAGDMPENALMVDLDIFKRVPGDPVAQDPGLKFCNHIDGQIRVAHLLDLFDELVNQICRAGGEGELDLR